LLRQHLFPAVNIVRAHGLAFQALQFQLSATVVSLVIPDGTYRGNRALTRCEFAAGLNACLIR